jgi:hypothetical protein
MECDSVYCQTSEMLWSGSGQLPGGKKKYLSITSQSCGGRRWYDQWRIYGEDVEV